MADQRDDRSPANAGFEFSVEHQLSGPSRQQVLEQIEQFLIAERSWPGCLNTAGPDPLDQGDDRYITRTRWTDVDHFVAWMVSDQRQDLLRRMEGSGYRYSASTNWSGFSAWIADPDSNNPPSPWRVNLLVLLCLYPTVLVLNSLINPLGMGYSTGILLGNLCSVALMGWLLVPAAQKLYANWLNARLKRRGNQLALLSIAGLLLLFWGISQSLSG